MYLTIEQKDFADEIETEFENTLACLSWAQMGLNHEKTKVENLVTHSHIMKIIFCVHRTGDCQHYMYDVSLRNTPSV